MSNSLLPLFPLEVVLLPEETLPLHIFEERYKTMIGECLQAKAAGEAQQEFGVVRATEQALSTIGCTARIVNVTRQYDDGRMDILTVGKRRFEILLTNEEFPFLRGAVDFFDDDGPDAPSEATAQTAIERFGEAMRKLRHAEDMPVHFIRPYRYLSFCLAGSLPFGLDFKQQLLSMRNEPERLAAVQRAIEILTQQIDQIQRSQARAGGNGHARH